MDTVLQSIIDDARATGNANKLASLAVRWCYRATKGRKHTQAYNALIAASAGVTLRLMGRISDAIEAENRCDSWLRHYAHREIH